MKLNWPESFMTPWLHFGIFRTLYFHKRMTLGTGGSPGLHMIDACRRWGGVKFLQIDRKITSVVHSHPPSHYIRKHAPGWLLVMFTLAVCKTKRSAFASLMPWLPCRHIVHMLHSFIAFLSCEWLSFLGRPYRFSAFATLHHLQAFSNHSVINAPFDVPNIWWGVTRVLWGIWTGTT